MIQVDWSAYALKLSSEYASGRVASRLFLVQDGSHCKSMCSFGGYVKIYSCGCGRCCGVIADVALSRTYELGQFVLGQDWASVEDTGEGTGEGVKTLGRGEDVGARGRRTVMGRGEDVGARGRRTVMGQVKTLVQGRRRTLKLGSACGVLSAGRLENR